MSDALIIDHKTTALVVIDLQKGIAMRPTLPHSSGAVIDNAAKLAAAFRSRDMPVFLVHVDTKPAERLNTLADEGWAGPAKMPDDWSDIVPELGPKSTDILISKKQWGAFYGTDLELQLRRRGIKTIVLCGIATNYGVESTARFAYEYGFQQIFPEDAMSSMSEEAHRLSVAHVLKRIGRVRSTKEVLDALNAGLG